MKSRSAHRMKFALGQLPDVLQVTADRSWERICERNEPDPDNCQWSANDCAVFARMLACSDYVSGACLRQWQWFDEALSAGKFAEPPQACFHPPANDIDEDAIKSLLRLYRHRQMLHILWREYASLSSLDETLKSLSSLADELLAHSCLLAAQSLCSRFGIPEDESGQTIPLVILAMGKLGGSELNFSSDIDIIFLYPQEGVTNGAVELGTNEYFTRLVRRMVRLLDDVTEDGFVFRVDTRLRPFGESGPLVASFASLESYLLKHGRDWERYAYVKARVIAGNNPGEAVAELMKNTIEPFVYRRYLDYGVFESLRDMHAMIATDVKKRSLASNIKLGPGGIREIEFIVQSLQLVRGGSNGKLRRPELEAALRELHNSQLMPSESAEKLLAAYRFLRRLENFTQAIRDEQTHEFPEDDVDCARLAFAMQLKDRKALQSALKEHRSNVTRCFREIAFRENQREQASPAESTMSTLWDRRADAPALTEIFERLGFANSGEFAKEFVSFAHSANVKQIGAVTEERLLRFMPVLFEDLRSRQSPHLVLQRVLKIVDRIIRRSAYIALLNENRPALQRLIDLCEQSDYLAGEIASFPLLLDEMLDPRLFTNRVSTDDMLVDITERLRQVDGCDSERRIEVLSQYQQATLFRVAIADFSGKLPVMKVSDALTSLAEIVLGRALDMAWRDLVGKHGTPWCVVNNHRRPAGLGVIAYGKFGGMELSYGSDLDLVFVHDSEGELQQTDGSDSLENSVFFARLVRRLVHFLTVQTISGALYDVDTRLRPSGRSGLLVISVEAFERYQQENAWTWEHQALLRSRPVAGNVGVQRAFERLRSETLRFRVEREGLAGEVNRMRTRMREQLDKSTVTLFDLKQGFGGIADLEFLVQYQVLKNAHSNVAVIHYRDNIRQLGSLAAADCLSQSDVLQLQAIYRAYRARLHKLALDKQPPQIDDNEFNEERRFVISLWERDLG